MLCYRGTTYCADQDRCAVPDHECSRRFTGKDRLKIEPIYSAVFNQAVDGAQNVTVTGAA